LTIDDTTTPWEAGLNWICKPSKGEFLGSKILVEQKQKGLSRKLAGFEMCDRLIARDGYPVRCGDGETGQVTSGGPAPKLKKNIGMAYVPPKYAEPGMDLQVVIRGQAAPARTVPLPFYKRERQA
jgi:aminomethyltransferase